MVRSVSFVTVFLASSIALAQQPKQPPAPPTPPPKAPSTGEEMAKPKVVIPEDAAAEMARALMKKGDCTGAVARMSTALSIAQDKLTKEERISGNTILFKCAAANKSWSSVIQSQAYLLDNAPDKANAEEMIRAYLKLGQDKAAFEMVKVIAKAVPSQRANLTLALTLIDCHRNDFTLCFNSSGKMLQALAKMKVTSGRPYVENLLFHAMSAAALGNYEVYDKEIVDLAKQLPKQALEPLKIVVEEARASKLFVDEDHAKELALGTYHLLTSKKIKNSLDNADALVTLRLVNQDKVQKSVKVSVEIAGVTDRMVETVPLPPGAQVTKLFSPPLKMDFDVTKLRAARTSQIAVRVSEQGTRNSLLDKTLPVQILPRDSLPLRRFLGNGGEDMRTTFPYAVAWVTPNAPEIDAFLKRAKTRLGMNERTKNPNSFSGPQQETLPQVQAIFEELKAMGVSYVMDPDVFDERGSIQRTRLPSEVLSSTNAQCLEGAILYASLLEAIGLSPVMVFKKGHAFIAWKPSKYDKTKAPLFFLETTMTGGPATFEQARISATNTFLKAAAEKQFEHGIGALLDVAQLRAAGYSPQPF